MLDYIESIGGRAFYITNNSVKSRKDYIEKFKKWNISTVENQFVTASYATCKYLKEHYEDKKLLVVGTPSFEDELKSFGLKLTHEAEEDVACVVVGFDRTLVYEKVEEACKALFRPEVDFVGTNPDYRCPTAFGFVPDCGGICEMLKVTTDRTPYYAGKPNAQIVKMCMEQVGAKPEEVLVVGDRFTRTLHVELTREWKRLLCIQERQSQRIWWRQNLCRIMHLKISESCMRHSKKPGSGDGREKSRHTDVFKTDINKRVINKRK